MSSAYIGVKEVRGQVPGTTCNGARTNSAINNSQNSGYVMAPEYYAVHWGSGAPGLRHQAPRAVVPDYSGSTKTPLAGVTPPIARRLQSTMRESPLASIESRFIPLVVSVKGNWNGDSLLKLRALSPRVANRAGELLARSWQTFLAEIRCALVKSIRWWSMPLSNTSLAMGSRPIIPAAMEGWALYRLHIDND